MNTGKVKLHIGNRRRLREFIKLLLSDAAELECEILLRGVLKKDLYRPDTTIKEQLAINAWMFTHARQSGKNKVALRRCEERFRRKLWRLMSQLDERDSSLN